MASAAAAKPTPLDGRFTVRLGQEGQGEEPTAAVLDFSIRGGREHAIPVVVSNVEAGGAAAEAGMEMGCEIIAVDGVSLDNASHAEAVRLLTAPRQSPLELTLRRNHVLKRTWRERGRLTSLPMIRPAQKKQRGQEAACYVHSPPIVPVVCRRFS